MVNYPNKKQVQTNVTKTTNKKDTRHRGMALEADINTSNEYYLAHDICVIYKKPTPVQIVKVDYPVRSAAKIIEAYFKVPSTTDYNGIYKGKYIDFEAKEIGNKRTFNFNLIHKHQIEHLERVIDHGGIGFIIIAFTAHQEIYLLDAKDMIMFYQDSSKKSITYEEVKNHGYLIPQGYLPRIDYIEVVEKVYFKGGNL